MIFDTIVCINKYRAKGVKGTLSVEAVWCFHFPSLLNWDQLLKEIPLLEVIHSAEKQPENDNCCPLL